MLQKSTTFVKVNTFLAILAFKNLGAWIPIQKIIFFAGKCTSVGGQIELTLVIVMQKSKKLPSFVKVKTCLAILVFKHLLATIITQK